MLCYKQPLIVAKCLVGIESHKACWHRQGVLADQEVLVVMDENVVLAADHIQLRHSTESEECSPDQTSWR